MRCPWAAAVGIAPLLWTAVMASPGSATAPPPGGLIKAPGGPFMTDQLGRRLEFHGFNLVAKCPSFSKSSIAPATPCIPDADHAGAPSYWLNPDPAYLAIDSERTFTDADAARLAALGFNIARVGIIWRALEPGVVDVNINRVDNPTYCASHLAGAAYPDLGGADPYNAGVLMGYLSHIDAEVALLAAHGIYSLIDMHQDAWNEHFNNPGSTTPWEGEGAPLWATCTDGATDTSSGNSGWNNGYLDNVAMADSYDHFWNNDVAANLQGQYLKVWRAVAMHYAGNPWVVGYDPFNEPYDTYNTPAPTFDRKLQCFYGGHTYPSGLPNPSCTPNIQSPSAPEDGFIRTVQKVDPQHLVFYEASIVTDFSAPETIGWAAFGGLPFDGLVLNFHNYGVSGGLLTNGDCTAPDCAFNENATQGQFETSRQLTSTNQPGGPAWFLSEFGAEDSADDIGRVAALADSSPLTGTPVSWTYWAALQLHDPTGSATERLFKSDRSEVQPKGLVLTRAYPRATAGTPSTQKFDVNTSVFDFAYAPDHAILASAPTEIVLPAPRYGSGYKVAVSGAAVTSGCGANPLTLVADQPATSVTVHVTPGAACGSGVPAVSYICNPKSPASTHNQCPPLPLTAAAPAPGWPLPGWRWLVAAGVIASLSVFISRPARRRA